MIKLSTDRLLLKPLSIDDACAIQNTFPQWEIVRWMDGAIPWPYPEDGALQFVTQIALPAMMAGTAWHWSIRPREEPHHLIGAITLQDNDDNNRGFWLDPSWQGRGLMTEASDAVTEYWFQVLGKEVLRVPKAVDNPPSRRISEKRGMRVVERMHKQLVSGMHAVELWEITREEWTTQTRHRDNG